LDTSHDKKDDKDFEKIVGSIVYFNHFHAIRLYIESHQDRYDLRQLTFFNQLKRRNTEFDLDKSRRFLLNSWGTEHALLFPRQFEKEEFHRYSLQWSFPQAYYSVYLNLAAFRETQRKSKDTHAEAISAFGASVKDGHYPKAIRFHASGLFNEIKLHHLPKLPRASESFNSSEEVKSLSDAHAQIASFLKSTRKRDAWEKRNKMQSSHNSALRTVDGQILKSFRKKYWDQVYKKIPTTSLMNLLFRMRITANYHDIETFLNAKIDFEGFYDNLLFIVDYLNFVHEAYLAKVVGRSAYENLLDTAPSMITENTASRRYELIKRNLK
jgi:hypothetical protein